MLRQDSGFNLFPEFMNTRNLRRNLAGNVKNVTGDTSFSCNFFVQIPM